MSDFQEVYKQLNSAQKLAVDTLDGPMLVVAGPGTGKTQLLSARVANILAKTDTLPQNILCLTFTESGATNMRERLVGLLGPEAHQVAIHTFHSFGSEIINRYGQYFYKGAFFRPADDLSSYEILSELLEKLPHNNPLSSKLNGRFTHLGDIKSRISELKRGGLTPDELDEILKRNDSFIEFIKPKLAKVFSDRISHKTIAASVQLAEEVLDFTEQPLELAGYHPLSQLVGESLVKAASDAENENSTKPLSAWKKTYLEKDVHDQPTLKDEKRSLKLRALSALYYDYLLAMQESELYDYDDMILRVVHALEYFDELRFTLQEQYQYILVDEFQDTNDAQMRLIWNLTNNPVNEGRPNLMVVGDDDQAIYRFQGAELSNILEFVERYRDVMVVSLIDNYRSTRPILELARSVIVQAEERLENNLEQVSKTLRPNRADRSEPGGFLHESLLESRAALVDKIAADIEAEPNKSRAVIARHHRELVELLPHLLAADISFSYERQENVLDSEPVKQLELVGHLLWHLGRGELKAADEHLPEILAHPAWNISTKQLWQISLRAYREKKQWLEIMLEGSGELKNIAEWCLEGAKLAKLQPLEYMLDYIFGITENSGQFISPYKSYFFGEPASLNEQYLSHLEALRKIRSGIREYRPDRALSLEDFLDYIDAHREMNIGLSGNLPYEQVGGVTLLSAHKAKGLEFDAVYITEAQETVWGSGARTRSRLISFPSNLPLSPAGDSRDERLRLLYVALTRAKTELYMFAASMNDQGKELLPVGALESRYFSEQPPFDLPKLVTATESDWRNNLFNISTADQKTLLAPLLKNYRLSATHLNNFLDIRKGGPSFFLLQNLLRLPEAMSPSAAYGSAVHGALQRAHQHLSSTGQKRPTEDILHDFEKLLEQHHLPEADFTKFTTRGVGALSQFLDQRYDSFSATQRVEQSFSSERVVVGEVTINGALDLIDIDDDEKTIFVTDYKTGKAASSWRGRDEFEKVKLHHYEQQLMMYKLLIENSRRFSGYTVTGARIEFIEPDPRGEVVLLDYVYDESKLSDFKRLILAVWQRIQALDFTLDKEYEESLRGILNFERDILT